MQKKNIKLLSFGALGICGIAAVFTMGAFQAKAITPNEEKTASVEQQKSWDDLWQVLPDNVATVNGKSVTRDDVKNFIQSQMPDGVAPSSFTAEQLKAIAPRLVRGMIEQQLLKAAMEEAKYTLSQQDAAQALQQEIDSLPKEQKDLLEKQLATENSSISQKIQAITADPNVMKQLEQKLFIEQTVLATVSQVTEAEAKEYYEKNKDQFKRPNMYQVSHILLVAKSQEKEDDKAAFEKAQAVYQQLLKNPQDFERLAKSESACPSKEQGGKLPEFAPGLGMMDEKFENAVIKIDKPGTIISPVKTSFGYHLIRLDKITPAQTTSFESAKNGIIRSLTEQRQQAAVSDYLKTLEKNSNVQYLVN